MLWLSWVIPTLWWFPLIFAWYTITGEKRKNSTECSIPFTHHTTFNTTLTICYFWIPLLCMISLYAGILRVAVGLQQKAMESEKGLANLMVMAGSTMSRIGLSVKLKQSSMAIQTAQRVSHNYEEIADNTVDTFAPKTVEKEEIDCPEAFISKVPGDIHSKPYVKHSQFIYAAHHLIS